MPSIWLLISTLALVSGQDYHYHRPATPFVADAFHPHQQTTATKFVVQTLGQTYGLETQRAPAIYEDHQTQIVQVLQQRQLPQVQQFHTSSYQNPLLVSTNYQAGTVSSAPSAPAARAQPLSTYGPPHLQHQSQPLLPPPPASEYLPQQQQQPPPSYLPPQQPPQKLFFANPLPYASVTTGSGQTVLDAGHGSGVAPNEVQTQLLQATGSSPPQVQVGDQLGQSQTAALDGYDYKQSTPGDNREYQRFVTSCPGGGGCQKKELGPNDVDESHKRVLQTVRASTQPRVEGCYKTQVIYVPVGAAVNKEGQLRPKSRRTFERKEQVLTRYPYN
ncbi:uncharacterized protein LOC6555265 [Drosophila erecta]|uniref:GG11117 n=1 Tax=Drosophila erecta TaxID=7220 RepID=B3P7L5_DROER|nr:uncharacterized protein LOC6555265 [Drosophila erecta]EDV54176.1 uncharacterized protein Dere_GG11117 [Drosophila erecta]